MSPRYPDFRLSLNSLLTLPKQYRVQELRECVKGASLSITESEPPPFSTSMPFQRQACGDMDWFGSKLARARPVGHSALEIAPNKLTYATLCRATAHPDMEAGAAIAGHRPCMLHRPAESHRLICGTTQRLGGCLFPQARNTPMS